MPTRTDVLEQRVKDLGQDLGALGAALIRDPKRQARSERIWQVLSRATTVLATLVARRMAGKTWRVLTGEIPPRAQK